MLLRGKFCTAPCRGGRLCLPDVSGIHRTSLFAVTPQLCLRRPTFSVAPEKVGKKMRRDALYCALMRANFFTPSSGANLQPCRWFSVRINVLHAVTGKLHQLRYCSFPEYSAGYDSAQQVVGADAHIGPRSAHRFDENLWQIRLFPTGRCGHRPLQTFTTERKYSAPPAHA